MLSPEPLYIGRLLIHSPGIALTEIGRRKKSLCRNSGYIRSHEVTENKLQWTVQTNFIDMVAILYAVYKPATIDISLYPVSWVLTMRTHINSVTLRQLVHHDKYWGYFSRHLVMKIQLRISCSKTVEYIYGVIKSILLHSDVSMQAGILAEPHHITSLTRRFFLEPASIWNRP